MSKWLDAVTHTGVYHMQQKHYNHIKPPSYFDHHGLNKYGFRRDREREQDLFENSFTATAKANGSSVSVSAQSMREVRSVLKSIDSVKKVPDNRGTLEMAHSEEVSLLAKNAIADPNYLVGEGRKDGGWGDLFGDNTSTYYDMNDPSTWTQGKDKGFASTAGGRTPSLFLQELTHLCSLCCAVAFTTLRSDIEGTEAPLDFYKAGSPWPETDPDRLKSKSELAKETLFYLFGFDRSPAMRTAHNKSRPLPVLGGISENEILFLQRARGASAKTTLAWHWLTEFIIREHLAGSLGNVGPPIISRIIQFLSDGMIYYNHARKTMFIPFPFPHAQISAFFVFTIMFAVPVLMDEYASDKYVGCALTFLTVTCLAGLHEVSRELENPFKNIPNEIPLVTLQAMFNEALITLFAGYHPDHFWDGDEYAAYGEQKLKEGADSDFTADSTLSPQKTPTNFNSDTKGNKPQSVSPPSAGQKPPNMKELQALVKKQQEDIERLCALVEGEKKDNGL